MNLLIDAQSFLWWHDKSEKLSKNARSAFESQQNRLYLSTATIWEIQIKVSTGKLTLPLPVEHMVQAQRRFNQLQLLNINLKHLI